MEQKPSLKEKLLSGVSSRRILCWTLASANRLTVSHIGCTYPIFSLSDFLFRVAYHVLLDVSVRKTDHG